MNNEEKSYELVKYEDGDLSIDVHVSLEDNTVWLTQKDMVTFFGVNKSGISRHIKDILKNNELDMSSVAQNATNVVTSDGKTDRPSYRSSKVYNLDMITLVGSRVKSNRVAKFRNWANNLANRLNVKNGSTKQLITFNYDEISLDVTVSPDEDTVWLSAQQMAILFDRDYKTILKHVKNVFDEGEVEQSTNSQKMRLTSNDKPIILYSLNVIISVGYRVKSLRGVKFRQWATSVLKEYLLTGHVVNEERCLTCTSNILSLENKVNKIQNEVNNLKDIIYSNNDKLFFEGEIVEAYSFIRKIFFLAKNELILIDNYADKFLLSMLTDIKVNITIITSINSYLNSEVLPNNIKIINNDSIHSRYIIADDYVYLIDNSFNNIGKKKLVIVKLDDINKDMIIKGIK